jgi:diguanylate cyclase (GGDEF)-like protein
MNAQLRSISPAVIDQLAELTRYRDRELLDITLASAFQTLLEPRSVAVYRKVGEPGSERWMTRARITPHLAAPIADPAWIKLSALPPLADHPARLDALSGRTVAHSAHGSQFTIFPLTTDRDVTGVIELETAAELNSDAYRVVISILHVYRNFESLLDYSERDTLTGLLNRKTFDETFLKSVSFAPSAGATAAERRVAGTEDAYFVGMIDIDFFKSVNDKYGHLIGDEVLLLQSRLMRNTFRFHDRLYRFGGEEFVVLMRCHSAADAGAAFERLRSNTQGYSFPQVGGITISVGFAQVREGESPSAALGHADQAVYYAKDHGRNQVHSYDELLASGRIECESVKAGEVDLF